MKKEEMILFSGGIKGAEAHFGAVAEQYGIQEVHFTFEGHNPVRQRGLRVLSCEELKDGDVSLEYVSRLLNRRFTTNPTFRKVFQSIWHQINNGRQIFVVGEILEDKTVMGGTGWGAEFAKICNKPLYVFDQKQNAWFHWNQTDWDRCAADQTPVITHTHFTGTGTRFLEDNGRQAIEELFKRSFA